MTLSNRSPLIISGMHRSGTSLIANFIHNSGIYLGERLLPANNSNPFGHYEDIDILDFHRGILEREFGHHMWVPDIPKILCSDINIAKSLVEKRSRKTLWGWKDPRTCLFLSLWSSILRDAYYLFVIRKPDLVVESLNRRNKVRSYQFWRSNKFAKYWYIYNYQCYIFIQKNRERCILISIDEVVRDPEYLINSLEMKLNFTFSNSKLLSVYRPFAIKKQPVSKLYISPLIKRRNDKLYRSLLNQNNEQD